LCGIATLTRRFVDAVAETGVRIVDTRKTTPGLRALEKACCSLPQVQEAVEAGADIIMLDNMSPEQMRQAVALVAGRAVVEASGGVSLQTVADVAATGVDIISIGKLTHSAPAVDISLEIEPA